MSKELAAAHAELAKARAELAEAHRVVDAWSREVVTITIMEALNATFERAVERMTRGLSGKI